MSLHDRIRHSILSDQRDEMLRALLERLRQNDQGLALLKEVIEALPGLNDAARQKIMSNPAVYFFPSVQSTAKGGGQVNKPDPIRSGMIPADAMEFLRATTLAGVNLIIAGDAGAGKTTLIEALVVWLAERPEPEKANVTINAGMLSLIRLGVSYLAELTVPSVSDSLSHLYTLIQATAPTMTQSEFHELLNRTPTLLIELKQLEGGTRKVTLIAEIQPDGTLKAIFDFTLIDLKDGRFDGALRRAMLMFAGMRVMEHMEAGGIILPNYFSFGVRRDK